jgi:enoyl-CoA hydratase/carnithine racemase
MTELAERVCYTVDGGVATLTLNRPDKLNAIDPAMIEALHASLDRAEQDAAVAVVLLRGAGRAFSCGFDLGGSGENDAADGCQLRAELRTDYDIIMRFWHCPKPTVAAVHHWCLGSAMEMAVACDITVSADDCRFGAPEVRFGSGIVALILPWVIGVKQAKELLLTGDDRVPASRALSLGLVNRVVPVAELSTEAMALARRIAGNDREAVRITKQAINAGCEIAGMERALQVGLEFDTLAEVVETPASRRFNEILAKDGVSTAIAWRDAQLSVAPDRLESADNGESDE